MDPRWIANACVAGVLSFAPLGVAYAESLKTAACVDPPVSDGNAATEK